MRTLLIDNYDSFTFNLFQLLASVNGQAPLVVRNDAAPWETLRRLPYDNIVLSPGPGRPGRRDDFGVCRDALLETEVPLLGVCLGHQGLCHAFGAEVRPTRPVVHGRPSRVHHRATGLFAGIPIPFSAIRYHSLAVPEDELPSELVATARTSDGVLMAVEHTALPLYGVQFHPESIGTEHGERLLANFRDLTEAWRSERDPPASGAGDGSVSPTPYALVARGPQGREAAPAEAREPLVLRCARLPDAPSAERVFAALFADRSTSFWLDSALVEAGARWSFMGDGAGPHAEHVRFDQASERLEVELRGESRACEQGPFDWIDRALNRHGAPRREGSEAQAYGAPFTGGYVGYLGYELAADSAAVRSRRSPSPSPDAELLFADRFLAFDHASDTVWLACLDGPEDGQRARQWLGEVRAALSSLEPLPKPPRRPARVPEPRPRHDRDAYLARIVGCQREIRSGEAYELCLTNRLELDVELDALATYLELRASNAAPFAALLHFPGASVLSSSPERFLRVDVDGAVEACPIKGTRPRGSDPEEDQRLARELETDEKERAENLMIVDLLRNDIGRVCEVGSVHVPRLFAVESYATVHQLVSTIRGRLRPGVSAARAARAAFPGGSMTGAPKRRAMEILDRLEEGPRGIYSGALGYFSLDGAADLSIVIRSIVIDAGGVSIGVGGAVTDLSDPASEHEETLVKARAPLAAVAATAEDGPR